jgi:hypothetical protein
VEGKTIYLERKEDLSLYYLLKDIFSDTSYINIEDGFPEKVLTLPTVSVEANTIELIEFELGNREGRRLRRWSIDIFAKNKSQRDEIGYRILNELKNGIKVYNYDEGFPPDLYPSKISHLDVLSRKMTIIKILPDLVEKMYYRATIEVVATNIVV